VTPALCNQPGVWSDPEWNRGRVLKQCLTTHGYHYVGLSVDGVVRTRVVHQLVAEAFIGPCPAGQKVCHGPTGKLDNRPSNLSYGSHSDNHLDKRRDGTDYQVNKTHCPLDHRLAPPNLVAHFAKRGRRNCLACARGRATVHDARKRGITLDLQTEADRHYVKIMAVSAA